MEPSPQARVLRCCYCRVFQAHQVKKSLKWTCKVCGEQQSFLRAYGEGSGADCRHHVQKLNVLQARLSETPHRVTPARPGRSEGAVTRPGTLGRALSLGGHQCATQQVRAMPSQWVRFLPPPGNSAQVDTEPSTLLQRGPMPAGAAQAEQGTPQSSNHKTTSTLQLSWATHTPCGPKRLFGVTPEELWGTGPQAEGGPLVRGAPESQLVRLQDLFNTGEDFDDIL